MILTQSLTCCNAPDAGAFTPGCSKTHLPGFVSDYDKLTKAGAQVIACTSVNDAFVMAAWGEQNGADGKVQYIASSCLKPLRLGVQCRSYLHMCCVLYVKVFLSLAVLSAEAMQKRGVVRCTAAGKSIRGDFLRRL